MTFEDPPRPRSTPIPDPSGPSSSPPPTPAQFLASAGQQTVAPPMPPPPPTFDQPAPAPQAPWGTPPTQQHQQPYQQQPYDPRAYGPQSFNPMAQIPVRAMSRIWIARMVIGIIIAIVGAVVAWRVVDSTNKKVDKALDEVSQQTIPDFTIPDFTVPTISIPKVVPPVSIPTVTVPDLSVPGITVPDISIPDVTIPNVDVPPVTVPNITAPDVTVPAAPPVSVAGAIPNGAATLWDAAATRPVLDQFEQVLPGDPTKFTMVVLYPDYAVAAAQDPDDPENTVGSLWRNGSAGAGPAIPAFDIDTHTFTEGDVDWDAVGGLVARAPQLMGAADGTVTHVIVERWDFDPTLPMRILVYVDGAGYVEAAADGTVIATH